MWRSIWQASGLTRTGGGRSRSSSVSSTARLAGSRSMKEEVEFGRAQKLLSVGVVEESLEERNERRAWISARVPATTSVRIDVQNATCPSSELGEPAVQIAMNQFMAIPNVHQMLAVADEG